MSWVLGLAIYVVIWWVMLFTVLPWGVKPIDEPGKGYAEGAPEKPLLLLKCAITTVIAGIVWAGLYFVVQSGVIDLRIEG